MKRLTAFISFAAILLFSAVSCDQSKGDYALSVSSEIRTTDPVVITVPDAYVINVGDNTPDELKKLVQITPKREFSVSLIDERTAAVFFAEPLEFNSEYKIQIDAGKLVGKKSRKISYDFKTLAPEIHYEVGGITIYPDEEDKYYLDIVITTSDPVGNDYIEKGIILSKDFPVSWQHAEDGLVHRLSINDIIPEKKQSVFTVSRKYELFNDMGSWSFNIPAEGVFVIISAEPFLDPYRYEIVFSSALDKKQVMANLVKLPKAGKLRFLIDRNKLTIYPTVEDVQQQTVNISKLIKNTKGEQLGFDWEQTFDVPQKEPFVKFSTKGVVLPSSNGNKLFFQSQNYAKVQVRVHRIFENNMLQYLQSERLDEKSNYILGRVAKVVVDTVLVLADPSSAKLKGVASYGLNITDLINVQKGALYRIGIKGVEPLVEQDSDYYESDYYFGSYSDYDERHVNILASDLAVIAKGSGKGTYTFFVTNIIDASPVSGAKVRVFDYVNQVIGEGSTGSDGKVEIKLSDEPHTAVVTSGNDKNYLKLTYGASLSVSNFDVGGTSVSGGQKGFIFGERGVWRPGDDIYITFVSMLDEGVLPSDHPVTAVLRNPQGQIIRSIVNNNGFNGMYSFRFQTADSDPTGHWQVDVTAGGQTYSKSVRIETVKPNKLLIDLQLDEKDIVPIDEVRGDLSVKWLVGSAAADLEARIDVECFRGFTEFAKYKNFVFEDRSRSFNKATYNLTPGRTDQDGRLSFNYRLTGIGEQPGMLRAVFTTRVFEKSGDFSIDSYTTTISPYKTYLGINVPEMEDYWGDLYLDKSKTHTIKLAAVDYRGNPVRGRVDAEVEVYKMGWSWWWGSSGSELASYSKDSYNKPYRTFKVSIVNGESSFQLSFTEESGYYFIRVKDPQGGHATSYVTQVYTGDDKRADAGSESATRLATSLDKDKYSVGEEAQLTIPSAPGARVLVSLEKGENVLKTFWQTCTDTKTTIRIPIERGMTPNVYASVTLIQPHNTTVNDAPIRLFGIQRIVVEDDATHLNPRIGIADEIRPESKVTLTVSERDGRPMSYVVALVDEGLLSLTRFKTPNPWSAFYATEALGVRSWDLYDLVIGAYGARMEQMFAIGGDGEVEEIAAANKAERFKPVSIFLGPFTIKSRSKQSHEITLPAYIGNLRVMVVATDGKAQGSAEQNVAVTKPLMVQSTLPRVIGTDEEVEIPITVFAMKNNLGKVTVSLSTNDLLDVSGSSSQTLNFTAAGEQMAFFKVKASSAEGIAKITAKAKCSADNAEEKIEIDVRDPNPLTTNAKTILLAGGKSQKVTFELAGKQGTNTAFVEASSIPPVDLSYRLDYLVTYPHGCIEQIVSSALPQLYLGAVQTLSDEQKSECETNIKATITKLPSYALNNGGMTYWPNTSSYASANIWGTIYALHFLVEAETKGYAVPAWLKRGMTSFVKDVASSTSQGYPYRTYAAYVLTLSGAAPRGDMNRMRNEVDNMNTESGWFLALAYAADKKSDVAKNIISKVSNRPAGKIDRFSYSFESEDRFKAVSAIAYRLTNNKQEAFKSIETLSKSLNDRNHFMSTQSTAWALNAVAAYAAQYSENGVNVTAKAGRESISLKDDKCIARRILDVAKGESIDFEFTNKTDAPTYIVMSSTGVPAKGQETDFSNGLRLSVSYSLPNGTAVDPFSLAQGTDFVIKARITNTSATEDYTNLILSQIFPSGWEIANDRTTDFYQDFRDDRVYSYFNLGKSASKEITIRATATYKGKFYLPSIICKAMYDETVNASVKGGWCEVK